MAFGQEKSMSESQNLLSKQAFVEMRMKDKSKDPFVTKTLGNFPQDDKAGDAGTGDDYKFSAMKKRVGK